MACVQSLALSVQLNLGSFTILFSEPCCETGIIMARKYFVILFFLFALAVIIGFIKISILKKSHEEKSKYLFPNDRSGGVWIAPDTSEIPYSAEGNLIRYGRALIVNTSYFLGPRGKTAHISNGMNCGNCHLNAGTKLWGNNFSGTFSSYPKINSRRDTIENIFQRINDCFQRSLNGEKLDSSSNEMEAIIAYIKWVGKDVPKNVKPEGSGIRQLTFLNRAADTIHGKVIFINKCVRCHGREGEGSLTPDSAAYQYPPLWGKNSFTTAAGMYRITRLAGFIKTNMPFGATYNAPQLTDEEAWDIAAYIDSRPRPQKFFKKDWPDISLKPIDDPFLPYPDHFSEEQHKYGPFAPIQEADKKQIHSINPSVHD